MLFLLLRRGAPWFSLSARNTIRCPVGLEFLKYFGVHTSILLQLVMKNLQIVIKINLPVILIVADGTQQDMVA